MKEKNKNKKIALRERLFYYISNICSCEDEFYNFVVKKKSLQSRLFSVMKLELKPNLVPHILVRGNSVISIMTENKTFFINTKKPPDNAAVT